MKEKANKSNALFQQKFYEKGIREVEKRDLP